MTVSGNWSGLKVEKLMSRKGWMNVCAAVLLLASALVSQTAPQTTQRPDRITAAANAGGMATVHGTVHPLTTRMTDMGAMNSQMELGALTLNVNLSAAQQKDLDALLEAQQDPKSPLYRQWLTQEEYGARFGLTDADLKAVTDWLTGQGFTVNGVTKSRNAIHFSGKVWQVESAFHTQMHVFQKDGETHFANTTDLRVPAGIGSVILNVRGLHNFRPKAHVVKRQVPGYTASTSTGTANFLIPADWATIYDVNQIYAQTCGSTACDGTGMHVGVVGQTYAPIGDMTNFRSAAGMTAPQVTYVCIDPTVAHCTGSFATAPTTAGDEDEADLDIQWSGGIAKNATVDYVYAPYSDACSNAACTTSVLDPVTNNYYDVFDALQHAIQDYKVAATGKVLPVISMSYGDCEESFVGQASYVTWVTSMGQQANTQGQTLVVSSGDSGAFECEAYNDYPALYGVSVDVPVDSPNYTGVGGTTLSGDLSSPSTYWIETPTNGESALSYIPESVWNDTAADVAAGTPQLAASGGGVSAGPGPSPYYAQPTWQPTPANYTGASGRFVPDIAFTSSPDHDGYLTCSAGNTSSTTGTDCSNGFLSTKNYWDIIGGTSAATPSFAGMLTLMVQKYGVNGAGLGNINPTLYGMAANAATYAKVFHDITNGNNIVPCTPVTTLPSDTGCTTGSYGWDAQVGYDLATGLGSIDGYQLFLALGGAANLTASTTTLGVSPTSPTVNQTVTLTATVASGSAAVTTTPTGTVIFTIDGVPGTSITLSGGTASTTKAFTTSGSHTVAIAYSGDSVFSSSTSSGSVVVSSLPATTTTLTSVTPNPVTINGTISLAASVTSSTAGTITGQVTFKVGSTTLGTGTLSGGVATLSNVAVTAANGFTAGTDSITASYPGDTNFSGSVSAATLETVNALPTYTLTANLTTATIAAGSSSSPITLTLNSTNYAGTVSFATSVTSSNGTASNVTVSTPAPVTLTSNGTGSSSLTITTSASAANHAPAIPWKSGGALIFCTVLLGAPFTFRRRRTLTVLVSALGLTLAGFMVACGGGGSSTPTQNTTTTSLAATPSTVKLGGAISLTASVNQSVASPAATGSVTFTVGTTTLGTVALANGQATLSNVTASTANGFSSGTTTTVLASYSGDSNFLGSSGGAPVTVTAVRTYTVTVTPTGTGVVTNPAPVVITVTVP